MKIFIMAFCICQISLARSNVIEVSANDQLAAQVRSVIDKNGQLPPVLDAVPSEFITFLNKSLSPFLIAINYGFTEGYLASIRSDHNALANGFKTAGISFETISAFVNYNLYAHVMNQLSKKYSGVSGVNDVVIQEIDLPESFKISEIAKEIYFTMNDNYRHIADATNMVIYYRDLYANFYSSLGSKNPDFFNDFINNILGDVAKVIDPAASGIIKYLSDGFAETVKAIVDSGVPVVKVMDDINHFGVYSYTQSMGHFTYICSKNYA